MTSIAKRIKNIWMDRHCVITRASSSQRDDLFKRPVMRVGKVSATFAWRARTIFFVKFLTTKLAPFEPAKATVLTLRLFKHFFFKIHPLGNKIFIASRDIACCLKVPHGPTIAVDAFLPVDKHIRQLQLKILVDPDSFRDPRNPARPVREPVYMHDDLDG